MIYFSYEDVKPDFRLRDCIIYYPYMVIEFLSQVLKLKNTFEFLILDF